MKNELTPNRSRLVALEECEQKIFQAFRKGMEQACAIAREFEKIEKEELYRDLGYESFNDYVQKRLRLALRTVQEHRQIGRTVETLSAARLELPLNSAQALELARVQPPERQTEIWQKVLQAKERSEGPLSTEGIRKIIDILEAEREERPKPPPALRPAKVGVTTELDLEAEAETNGELKSSPEVIQMPEQVTFSEKGEAALERITRLCGKVVGQSIANGNLPITERELQRWADQEDELVKSLAHYISNMRWSVAKALVFENKAVEDLTVVQLEQQARARGGKLILKHGQIKITVELAAAA